MQRRKTVSRLQFTVIVLTVALSVCLTLPSYAGSSPYQNLLFRPHPSLGCLPGGLIPGPFRFVIATDSHFGSAAGNKGSALAFQAIRQNHGNAAFLVHIGDITETGAASEYDIYDTFASSLPFPVLNTLGNHESRWQDRHGQVFQDRYGSKSYSFNYRGWHFVVLDTSYPGQTYGTIDPATLAWLERDLESLPPDRPVAIFAHHPLLYEARKFQDADDALLPLLDKYPVQVLFCGHGHTFLNWKAQGRDVFMIGALMDGAYAVAEVSGDEMRVYSERVSEALSGDGSPDAGAVRVERTLLGTVTVKPVDDLRSPVVSVDASVLHEGATLSVTLDLSEEASLYYQIDNGPFVSLVSRDTGVRQINLDVSGHAKGLHTLRLKAYTSSREGPYYVAKEFGKLERDLVLWKLDLGSAMTGTPLWASLQRIVVGTRNGRVLMVDISTGKKVWEYNAGSSWCGGAIDGGKLYFTTSAGELVCLDVTVGGFRWKTTLDESGFSSGPTIVSTRSGKAVIAGAASGRVYAVNPVSGLLLWSFQSGGAITGGIAAGEDRIVFGTWGAGIYAVDPGTGTGTWSAPLGRQIYYSPALRPLPLGSTVYTTTPLDNLSGGSFLHALGVSDGLEVWKLAFSESLLQPTVPLSSLQVRDLFSRGIATSTGWVHPFLPRDAREIIVPDSAGMISAYDPESGGLLWQLRGDGTLFSAAANLDSIYVTGGTRGLINIFVNDVKIDYRVRDSFLFENPLVVVIPVESWRVVNGSTGKDGSFGAGSMKAQPVKGAMSPGFYAVITGDTRGTLWAIAVPEIR